MNCRVCYNQVNMNLRLKIQEDIQKVAETLLDTEFEAEVMIPTDSGNGDYTTNIAMTLSKILRRNPVEIAGELKKELEKLKLDYLGKIEVAKPGFLNIWLSEAYLSTQIEDLLRHNEKVDLATKSQKIMVEFGDPNPFKEIHIGHLRNLTVSESFARLLSSRGYKVVRANYQGDVGMHVSKAIYGVLHSGINLSSLKTLKEKVGFLAKCYAQGASEFEDNEVAKNEIIEINKKVYSGDPEITKLWKLGRQWSLDSFEEIYKLLGVVYDFYYFESNTAPEGKKLVENFLKSGVFEEDQGAIILKGEKSGLHTRVFITKDGNPTYEAKDLALALMKYKDYEYDKSYIITANEQVDYFKVILKALSLIAPEVATRNFHYSFGFVSLKDGKMSSRTGNIISAMWLIDEAKKHIKDKFSDIDEGTLTKVAVGAIKYSMLKFGRESDVKFSFEESINLHGNSGPYIQYAYARTQSILKKSGKKDLKNFSQSNLASEQLAVARAICHFEDAVFYSAENFAPNILCNYLFDLSNKFNLFYEKHKVIGAEDEDQKLALIYATGQILKKGLYLLGIDAPDKL